MKNKLLIILGTRPEIIKLFRSLKKSEKFFTNILVNTNQNYDKNLNNIFFKDLNLKHPKYLLRTNKQYSANQKSPFLFHLLKNYKKRKIDAALYLGDTNTCYSLIPVKKFKIPIFHLEAGNRCFDERV